MNTLKHTMWLAAIWLLAACGAPAGESAPTTENPADQPKTETLAAATPQAPEGKLPEAAPFHFEVVESSNAMTLGVQSFAAGHSGTKWMFVGGRTNGFHLTFSTTRTFPTKYSNENFVVYDVSTNSTSTLAIPDAYKIRLRATNMEYYQDGDILYCVGGYGSNCPEDNNNCYITMPYITAINVPNAIAATESGDSDKLANAIVSLEDERMTATGGILQKVGDYFYLVFGQNYKGKYKSGLNGTYTEQIARFKLNYTSTSLAIEDYKAYKDPSGKTGFESQYRRRDLNVCEEVFGDGTVGLSVWGGVFTIDDLGWPNPIFIKPDGSRDPDISVQTDFELKCNYYESANLGLYDPSAGVMYTTLFGGVSNWFYNDQGVLVPGTNDNALPFVNIITTLGIASNGTREYVQPQDQGLPALIGANAEFFPTENLAKYEGTSEIYDLSKISGDRVLVGYIAGGIRSTAAQTRGDNPSFANEKIYEVYFVRP